MPTNLPPKNNESKIAPIADGPPMMDWKNLITVDKEAEKGMYNDEYLSQTAGAQGIGKRNVFINSSAVDENLREYLDMTWTDTRMQNGADYISETVKISPRGYAPYCLPNPQFYGPKLEIKEKGYTVIFRPQEYTPIAKGNLGAGGTYFAARREKFYLFVKGQAEWMLQADIVPSMDNIIYNFKNIAHFQYIAGSLSHADFISQPHYSDFTIQEKLLLDEVADSEGPGTMLGGSDKVHHDFYFELQSPYTKNETQISATNAVKLIEGDIATTFNFDSPKYVKFSSEGGYYQLVETQLPNFYSYLSEYDACKKTPTVGGEAPGMEGQTTSDITMGGHYDQLTLGGLLPYNSIPFNIKIPGYQKLSMLDLVTQQQQQHTAYESKSNKDKYIKEGSEYLSTVHDGAPYFENFSEAFKALLNPAGYDASLEGAYDNPDSPEDASFFGVKANFISEYNRSIVFTRDNMKYLQDFNDKADIFPYHVKLEIPNSTNSVFSKMLYDLDLELEFLSMITFAAENNITAETAGNQQLLTTMPFSGGSEKILQDIGVPGFEAREETQIRCYDVFEFMNVQNEAFDIFSATDPKNYIGPGGFQSVKKKMDKKKQQSLTFKSIMQKLLLIAELEKLVEKNFRTYQNILKGKQAYKEIVAYRVAKHVVSGAGDVDPVPIQNMFFMNKEDVDSIIYHDTQVKYNRKYKYIVYAYVFTIGNRYAFSHTNNYNTEGSWWTSPESLKSHVNSFDMYSAIIDDAALKPPIPPDTYFNSANHVGYFKKFELRNAPDLKILEVPYFEFSGEYEHQLVMDNPPLHPQITFTPYREINNRLLITLETTLGKYSSYPINILPEDENYYALARLAQNKLNKHPIEFKAEDSNSEYQIFRIGPRSDGITEPPLTYFDFSDALYVTQTTNSSLATLEDTIERNRVYYYMFRAIDRRGGISPPSPVYKVELVGDPNYNLSYPRIKVYEMGKEKNKKSKKPFRRYLHLNPHIQHISVNGGMSGYEWEDSANTGVPPYLGTAKESMVGKHNKKQKSFKIRLTSRATGRKIDFNVKFVHRHVKNV